MLYLSGNGKARNWKGLSINVLFVNGIKPMNVLYAALTVLRNLSVTNIFCFLILRETHLWISYMSKMNHFVIQTRLQLLSLYKERQVNHRWSKQNIYTGMMWLFILLSLLTGKHYLFLYFSIIQISYARLQKFMALTFFIL